MTADLLTGLCIGLMIGMGFALLTNDSWYRYYTKMNEEWYERCKSLIDGENDTCEKIKGLYMEIRELKCNTADRPRKEE